MIHDDDDFEEEEQHEDDDDNGFDPKPNETESDWFLRRSLLEESDEYKQRKETELKKLKALLDKRLLPHRKANSEKVKVKNKLFEIYSVEANSYLYTLKFKGNIINTQGNFGEATITPDNVGEGNFLECDYGLGKDHLSFPSCKIEPKEFFDFDVKYYPDNVCFQIYQEKSLHRLGLCYSILKKNELFKFEFVFLIVAEDLMFIDVKPNEHIFSFLDELREIGFEMEYDEDYYDGPFLTNSGVLDITFPATGNLRDAINEEIVKLEQLLKSLGQPSGSELVSLFKI